MQRAPFCSLCHKPYAFQGSGKPVGQRIPKLLDCSHTFCQGCLTKLSLNKRSELYCPKCNEATQLLCIKKSVNFLPINLYIIGILCDNLRANIEKDFLKNEIHFSDVEGLSSVVPQNEYTYPGHPVVEKSSGTLCDECCEVDDVHSTSRTLLTHEAKPLHVKKVDSVGLVETSATHNLDHPKKKLACNFCTVTPSSHAENIAHEKVKMNHVKEKMEQAINNGQKIERELKKSKEKLASYVPMIKVEFSEIKQQIQDHFQNIHSMLQARESCLIKEVKEIFCKSTLPNEIADSIEKKMKHVSELIAELNAFQGASETPRAMEQTLLECEKLNDIDCILSDTYAQNLVTVTYNEDIKEFLKSYGKVDIDNSNFGLKKISEVSERMKSSRGGLNDICSVDFSTEHDGSYIHKQLSHKLVVVSHILSPTDFYVRYVSNNEILEDLMEKIHVFCDLNKKTMNCLKTVNTGDLVIIKVDGWWQRGRVMCKVQQGPSFGHVHSISKVRVYAIDHGSTHVLPLKKLFRMPSKFSDLPELVVNCSLFEIVPPDYCKNWQNNSIKAFGSMTCNKNFLMAVVKKSGRKFVVDLKSSETDGTTSGLSPASVRDALVFLEVAKFKSPASVTNSHVPFPIQTYPKVVMPKEGETLQVIVSYVQSPNSIFVQRCNGEECENMLKILQQMFDVFSSKSGDQWQIGWPYKDMVCAARYSEDGRWYRALIIDVTSNKIVKVLFVDFGNSEELRFSEIRRLPDHLAKLPKQAMECCLSGITPIDEEIGWSADCCTFLNDNCFLHPYDMTVVEERDTSIAVVLHLPAPKHALTLSQQLIDNSFAASCSHSLDVKQPPTSPTSSTNSSRCSETKESNSNMDCTEEENIFPEYLCYKPAEMPECNNFKIVVTYVRNDCTIFGFLPGKYDQPLADLMKNVQTICDCDDTSACLSQDQLSLNQPCYAKYLNDNEWYRAQIVQFPSENTVFVEYVDFGNREEIPLSHINVNSTHLDIPKRCISLKMDTAPKNGAEQERISKVLEKLLIGEICEAKSATQLLVNDVLYIENLLLPNGEDALEKAYKMFEGEEPLMLPNEHDAMEKGHKMFNTDHGIHTDTAEPLMNSLSPAISKHSKPKKEKFKQQLQQPTSIMCETILPAEGIPFRVTVTHINSKNSVYLQRKICSGDKLTNVYDHTQLIANQHLKKLLDLSRTINLNNYFDKKKNISKAWVNMLCCAQYTCDDLWYRAVVQEVLCTKPLQVRVLYFDYGTSEVLEAKRLKALTADLASLPKQAFPCAIVGLGDDNLSTTDEYDKEDGIDALAKAIYRKKLVCVVVSFGPPIQVELYDRVIHGDSFEDVPISERLSKNAIHQWDDKEDKEYTSSEDENIGSDEHFSDEDESWKDEKFTTSEDEDMNHKIPANRENENWKPEFKEGEGEIRVSEKSGKYNYVPENVKIGLWM
ncbi:RING finger protein 17-like [Xenia sp. Carnegie-2017]|uniref:RING finger protein 17-like n=1 Tax=Xenia sp. Carnegie-2017 TaxID=2897299 RepID=UPI001F044F66|nr:RING finger protein 17-like [Xenia sp. Carnegie-2017]